MHLVPLVTQLLFACASLGQSIHREEVCEYLLAVDFVLYDVGPDNVFLWKHVMNDFILTKLIVDLVLRLLLVVESEDLRRIFLLHLSDFANDLYCFDVGQLILSFELFHYHVGWLIGVLDLYKFLHIYESIHIVSCGEGCWHDVSGSIVCLWVAIKSLSSHHLLDNDLGQSLAS